MSLTWWQLLVFFGSTWFCLLASVMLGAYMVFKTKHAQFNIPFLQVPTQSKKTSGSYLDESLFNDYETPEQAEEPLSPGAERLARTGSLLDKIRPFINKKQGTDA